MYASYVSGICGSQSDLSHIPPGDEGLIYNRSVHLSDLIASIGGASPGTAAKCTSLVITSLEAARLTWHATFSAMGKKGQ